MSSRCASSIRPSGSLRSSKNSNRRSGPLFRSYLRQIRLLALAFPSPEFVGIASVFGHRAPLLCESLRVPGLPDLSRIPFGDVICAINRFNFEADCQHRGCRDITLARITGCQGSLISGVSLNEVVKQPLRSIINNISFDKSRLSVSLLPKLFSASIFDRRNA